VEEAAAAGDDDGRRQLAGTGTVEGDAGAVVEQPECVDRQRLREQEGEIEAQEKEIEKLRREIEELRAR
jgi:hypothetical protein